MKGTTPMTTCTAHRGLYRCTKPVGHDGRHHGVIGADWLDFAGPGHDHADGAYCTVKGA